MLAVSEESLLRLYVSLGTVPEKGPVCLTTFRIGVVAQVRSLYLGSDYLSRLMRAGV